MKIATDTMIILFLSRDKIVQIVFTVLSTAFVPVPRDVGVYRNDRRKLA